VRISKVLFTLLVVSVVTFLLPLNDADSRSPQVYIAKIEDDTINPITQEYITKSINRAYEDNAECLVIELDTPGGLLTSTRGIVKEILKSEVPICVYIYPGGSRAGSAGVFITYASHVAAMAPSTNIGAAHPVNIGGDRRSFWDGLKDLMDSSKEDKKDKPNPREADILSGKILNDTVAFIKSIAEKRGRNVKWAEESVTKSSSVTEKEALKNNIIDIIARDEDELLEKLNGRVIKLDGRSVTLNTKDVQVRYLDKNFRQRFLNVLANPNIAYILLMLGFYGLLFEVTHPGVGFPGVAGAICIILAFFSMQTLPTNYAGLALILLGVILFIAEVKMPGFGLLTLGGVVSMTLGALILFESPYEIMRVSLVLALSSSLATAGITVFLVGAVVRAHRKKVISGKEGLIGEVGKSKKTFDSGEEGKIFVHGEIWDATSKERIKKGDKVKVVKIDGMTLTVEKV